jgi:hypothetical protein
MHAKGPTCLCPWSRLRSQTSKKTSETSFEHKFTVICAHTKNTIKHDTFETLRPHAGNPRFLALSYGKKHSPSPGGGWVGWWLVGGLAGWVGWAGWLVGWLGWLDGWLAGLAGWLDGWVGWLAGWLVILWLVTLRLVWYIGFDIYIYIYIYTDKAN